MAHTFGHWVKTCKKHFCCCLNLCFPISYLKPKFGVWPKINKKQFLKEMRSTGKGCKIILFCFNLFDFWDWCTLYFWYTKIKRIVKCHNMQPDYVWSNYIVVTTVKWIHFLVIIWLLFSQEFSAVFWYLSTSFTNL